MHDVSWPGQFDLQLALVLHEEVHQGPGDCGRCVEEEGRDPQDGSLQLLQAEEEVVPVLNGQKVVVVALQDAGVKSGHVGLLSHVFRVNLRRGEVAAEHKVGLVDLGAALAARQDAAVADHRAYAVLLVVNG